MTDTDRKQMLPARILAAHTAITSTLSAVASLIAYPLDELCAYYWQTGLSECPNGATIMPVSTKRVHRFQETLCYIPDECFDGETLLEDKAAALAVPLVRVTAPAVPIDIDQLTYATTAEHIELLDTALRISMISIIRALREIGGDQVTTAVVPIRATIGPDEGGTPFSMKLHMHTLAGARK